MREALPGTTFIMGGRDGEGRRTCHPRHAGALDRSRGGNQQGKDRSPSQFPIRALEPFSVLFTLNIPTKASRMRGGGATWDQRKGRRIKVSSCLLNA
jgi:hypothetical protein